ncbi:MULTISPECIES: IclR family transcriptional regulator [Bartonella]|uniref:IclR family transcriptional regulator n=1 Tax=Bartonella TaxID=773 RepID=UPI0018DDCDB3|nr:MULTISPECIES: IclR family transcriptional regulator [Bartonella]MBH9974388.1 IclR family transcriptional regulator [Bartonella choladocola]MBI0013995.1 IclR family transcriptional regulator [Bartonella sp. B10834G3]
MARKRTPIPSNDIPLTDSNKVDRNTERHFVTALGRGLKVLACFRHGDILLSNNDISERCNLPRSTVSRLTYTLMRLGYLYYVESKGKYRLGAAVITLGTTMLSSLTIRSIAKPYMQELSDMSKASVGLGIADHRSALYLEYCTPADGSVLPTRLGTRISIINSAMGRALLAASSERDREAIFYDIRRRDEIEWPEIYDGIKKAIHEHETTGCCTSFQDWQQDVNAIAAGFNPGEGLPVMSINVAGPAKMVRRELLLGEVKKKLLGIVQLLKNSQTIEGGNYDRKVRH